MNNLYHRLTYYPVNVRTNGTALRLTPTYLANALAPVPSRYLNCLGRKLVMCDSGGLQVITKGTSLGKIVLIGPMLKTRTNDPEFLTIGLFDNAKEYLRLKSSFAFCVDIPGRVQDSDFVHYYKVSESIKARDRLLNLAEHCCPETKMGIVLQPRNPLEVERYFGLIATPKVRIYAYPPYPPGRGRKDALSNAYVLSFLQDAGVRHFHCMGSSSVPLIIILAKAVVAGLFDNCTFDSLTWNSEAVGQGYRLLNPETLSRIPKGQSLNPDSDLRWVLEKYPHFFRQFEKRFLPPEWMAVHEWLGIVNIQAIEYFKNRVLDMIKGKETSKLLANLGPKQAKSDILKALNLLDESKTYGHDFVRKRYRKTLLKQYEQDH